VNSTLTFTPAITRQEKFADKFYLNKFIIQKEESTHWIAFGSSFFVWCIRAGHHGIDVLPDGKWVYVSGIGSDQVSVINAKTLEVDQTIMVGPGPHGIRASADGRRAYVALTGANEIVVIDAKKKTVYRRISTGNVPCGLAVPNNP